MKPYGFDKMYMDKELIEDKIYQIIDQFIKSMQYINDVTVLLEV